MPSVMIRVRDFDRDRVAAIIRALELGLGVDNIRQVDVAPDDMRLFLSLPPGAEDGENASRIARLVAGADGGATFTRVEELGPIDWRRERATRKVEGAFVAVSTLLQMPGLRDEHLSIGTPESITRIEKLAASMRERGFLAEHPAIIVVAPQRDARVYEGNHRIRAAALAGLARIPVDIHFLRGAEADGYPL